VEGDALVGGDEEHGAAAQSHFGSGSCGGAHGCPSDHQQDAGRVHSGDEVQLDGGGDLQREKSPRLESPPSFPLGSWKGVIPVPGLPLPLPCPGSMPAAAQTQGPRLSWGRPGCTPGTPSWSFLCPEPLEKVCELRAGGMGQGKELAALPGGDTSIPKHPPCPPWSTSEQTHAKKTPADAEASYREHSRAGGRPVPPVAAHLYPHDGKVRHGGVVDVDAGVELALHGREDLGAAGRRRVVEHLAQGEDVDEFGGQPGAHRVIRARHALHAVCTGAGGGHGAALSAHPSPPPTAAPGEGSPPRRSPPCR